MNLSVPVTHTRIHCKLRLYKTHRPIKIRIENSYAWVLEAASDSGSMVHVLFLTINSIFLIFRIVLCTHKPGKSQRISPVKLLEGNHDRSKYHKYTTDNHDISKSTIPAFSSTFQF